MAQKCNWRTKPGIERVSVHPSANGGISAKYREIFNICMNFSFFKLLHNIYLNIDGYYYRVISSKIVISKKLSPHSLLLAK